MGFHSSPGAGGSMLGSAKSCLTAAEAFFFSKRILLKKKIFPSDRNANTVKSQTKSMKTVG